MAPQLVPCSNFEHNGKLLFLFVGADSTYTPTWTTVSNPYKFHAGDTFANSYTLRAEDGLRLNYFLGKKSETFGSRPVSRQPRPR